MLVRMVPHVVSKNSEKAYVSEEIALLCALDILVRNSLNRISDEKWRNTIRSILHFGCSFLQ